MRFLLESDSLEDIHRQLMWSFHNNDPDFITSAAPRGKPIREMIGGTFTLLNPRNRLILSPARKVNYGFAVGELCWYLRGDNDLETMLYYNRRMSQFSDDGRTINSAYGYRMFKSRFRENQFSGSGHDAWDRSQFDNVLEELRRDPDSRRAVMHINEPSDLDRATTRGSKDVPCTMSIQLLIRDRRLHMHVLMRSNDVVWGLPYDVFSFTCLQELFLRELQDRGVAVDALGHYHHTAGSLHIYDTHFDMAGEVSEEQFRPAYQMPDPMAMIDVNALKTLVDADEPFIRSDKWPDPIETSSVDHTQDAVGWMFRQLILHKNKRLAEAANKEKSE